MQQGSYPIGSRTINVNTDNATGVVTGATCDIPLSKLAQAIQTYLNLGTPIAIAYGGTGATTAPQARTNLGLGTIATQNANAVAISGGSIDGTTLGATTPSTGAFTTVTASTPIAVSSGGTGANTFTAHGVLVGEGTGAVTATGTGTSGQPLLSGGNAADPAYGNLGAAAGGTGRTTLTAHAVLLGEGTSAVNFASPATAGQALISTGATTDPIFGSPTGVLLNIQTFNSTATYTPTTGTNSVVVLVVAGGGAGGGAVATGAGQTSGGTGGNSGSVGLGRITSSFSGVTVTVGTGGTGVSGANGNAGNASSFGALITTVGGAGGFAAGAGTPNIAIGTASSAGSGGSILNASGNPGSPYISLSATGFVGGNGGSGLWGGSGLGNVNGTGNSSLGPGGGGGGASNGPSLAARAGASGANGIVIVYEYA